MLDWYRRLNSKRRFLVTWNVLMAPVFVAGMTAFVILSGFPFVLSIPFALFVAAMAVGGFIIGWKAAR